MDEIAKSQLSSSEIICEIKHEKEKGVIERKE